MNKPELEAALETRCVDKIEARGGLALKLRPPTGRGFPDRTILLPGNNGPIPEGVWRDVRRSTVFFCEFKRQKTGVVAAQQTAWRRLLTLAGFGVYFCDNDADFDAALEREMNHAI